MLNMKYKSMGSDELVKEMLCTIKWGRSGRWGQFGHRFKNEYAGMYHSWILVYLIILNPFEDISGHE